jgi:hypothetical protein
VLSRFFIPFFNNVITKTTRKLSFSFHAIHEKIHLDAYGHGLLRMLSKGKKRKRARGWEKRIERGFLELLKS